MFYMDLSQIFTLSTSQKDDLSQCNKLSNNNKNYLISRKNGGGAERVLGGNDQPPRDPHGARTPGDEMAHHRIYTTLQIEFQQVI